MEVLTMSLIYSIIKSSNLDSIKLKFIALYTLNITDLLFTLFLVNVGICFEGNFIMAPLVNNSQLASIAVKTLLPLPLLIGVYKRMKTATNRQLMQANIVITGAVLLYSLINIFHIIWTITYTVIAIY
jgi:hypothetical protein